MEIEEGKLSLRLQLDEADLSKLCQNLSAPLVQLPKDSSTSETTFNIGYFVKGSLAIDHVNDIILLNIDLQQSTQTRGIQTGENSSSTRPTPSTPKLAWNIHSTKSKSEAPPAFSKSTETPPESNLPQVPTFTIDSDSNDTVTKPAPYKPPIKHKPPLNLNWGIKTKSGKTSWKTLKPLKRLAPIKPSLSSVSSQKTTKFRYRDPYLKVLYRLKKKGVEIPAESEPSPHENPNTSSNSNSETQAALETPSFVLTDPKADSPTENSPSGKMVTVGGREPRYVCNLCGARYRSKVWFDEHTCSKPKEDKAYECPHCSQILHTKFSLENHVRLHAGDLPYSCSVCKQCFKCYSTMRYHERKHMHGKEYECALCDKSYTHITNLKNHMKTHTAPIPELPPVLSIPSRAPEGESTFENAVAEACADLAQEIPVITSNSTEEVEHMEPLLGNDVTEEGDQEEEAQYVRCGVNRRKRKVRNKAGRANYECQVCGISYNSRVWFEEHQCSGTKRLVYRCEECGKLCYTKFSYRAHANLHKGLLPYECETCHEKFDSISRLRYHEKKHGDSFPYKCHLCDKAYTHVSNLKIHLLAHSGSRPYQCEHCGRMFSTASKLKLHINTHTRVNQTECPECKKLFSAREQMLRHIRRMRCPVIKERMRSNGVAAGEGGEAEQVEVVDGEVENVEVDMSGLLPDQIVDTVVVICEKGSEGEFASDNVFLLTQDSDADKS